MSKFIRWNSQPLDVWASKHAQGQFIDLDGCTTHYIERGEGEPIILLHGYNYDSFLWADNIDVLAEKFKVYALDLWGFGYSTRKPLDYGYQLYADQVLMFMDALWIQSASLVGQSMGGGTAILFCVQHRQRVNKLLLVAPASLPHTFPLIGKFFNLPRVGEFVMSLSTNAIRKKTLGDFWIYNKKLITESYFENVTRFQKIKGTTEVLTAILRKEFIYTLSDEVHRLGQEDVPILIVWGREDKTIPVRLGQEMHRILLSSRLEVIDNAGHVPNYECSDVFNRLALDFLQE
jgi:pimeloyl-ACP methyl ester carboxylesterase